MNSSQKKFWSQILQSKTFVVLVVLLVFLASWALVNGLISRHAVEQDIQILESEITALEQQNLELTQMISYLQTEEFAEREAREKFDLQKPGEKVVVIPRTEEDIRLLEAQTNGASTNGEPGIGDDKTKEVANPKRWWNYFFASH